MLKIQPSGGPSSQSAESQSGGRSWHGVCVPEDGQAQRPQHQRQPQVEFGPGLHVVLSSEHQGGVQGAEHKRLTPAGENIRSVRCIGFLYLSHDIFLAQQNTHIHLLCQALEPIVTSLVKTCSCLWFSCHTSLIHCSGSNPQARQLSCCLATTNKRRLSCWTGKSKINSTPE